MGSIGTQEIIIIFIIALIVLGPRKLPQLGKTIGKGMAEFRKASNELKKTWEDEVQIDKEKSALNGAVSDATGNLTDIVKDVNKSVSDIVNDVKNSVSDIVSDMTKSIDSAGSTPAKEESKTESPKEKE